VTQTIACDSSFACDAFAMQRIEESLAGLSCRSAGDRLVFAENRHYVSRISGSCSPMLINRSFGQ
jgi:hypothetical protein